MPIYEYQCRCCGHKLEKLQKFSDPLLLDCPECHKPDLQKLISASGFRLKGSGWYETDFKTDGKRNLAGDQESGKAAPGAAEKPDGGKSDAVNGGAGKVDGGKVDSANVDGAKADGGKAETKATDSGKDKPAKSSLDSKASGNKPANSNNTGSRPAS